MWKKTFIRLTFSMLIITATFLIVSAFHTRKTTVHEKNADSKECCKNNNQGDIMIWESVSRTILGSVQY